MKKRILIILIFLTSFLLAGCNFIEEQKAKRMIEKYYQAIIDEDYEKAFNQLHLFDYDPETGDSKLAEGTKLSIEEAKAFYLKKIDFLKEENYQLKSFEIVEVEYEDGHSFWHHIKLEGMRNDVDFEFTEIADMYEGKLLIGEKEDPYAKYRDGKMNFDIDPLGENKMD